MSPGSDVSVRTNPPPGQVMLKLAALLALAASAEAFSPATALVRARSIRVVRMEADDSAPAEPVEVVLGEDLTPPAPPAPSPAPSPSSSAESAMIAVNEDSVKATVGVSGAVAGFALAGPVGAVVGATLSNYVANKDGQAGEIASTLGTCALLHASGLHHPAAIVLPVAPRTQPRHPRHRPPRSSCLSSGTRQPTTAAPNHHRPPRSSCLSRTRQPQHPTHHRPPRSSCVPRTRQLTTLAPPHHEPPSSCLSSSQQRPTRRRAPHRRRRPSGPHSPRPPPSPQVPPSSRRSTCYSKRMPSTA